MKVCEVGMILWNRAIGIADTHDGRSLLSALTGRANTLTYMMIDLMPRGAVAFPFRRMSATEQIREYGFTWVEFGMEGECDDVVLADGGGIAVKRAEYFHISSSPDDFGGADKGHGDIRFVGKPAVCGETSELSAISVADDGNIDAPERIWGTVHFPGHEDQSGTCGKDLCAFVDLLP